MQELNFEKIGQKLREVRISRNLTQEYIANMVDINTSHISNIENNRVKISLTTLVFCLQCARNHCGLYSGRRIQRSLFRTGPGNLKRTPFL